MKATEIRKEFFTLGQTKLEYLSFISALANMGDITQKQFDSEAAKINIFVCDVLNKDGTFKKYLNDYTIQRLKKYFDSLHNYKMSDIVPFSAF